MITGKTRYRLGWRGKMILQVSEWQRRFSVGHHPAFQPWVEYWRDGTFRDIINMAEGKVQKDAPPFEQDQPQSPGRKP